VPALGGVDGQQVGVLRSRGDLAAEPVDVSLGAVEFPVSASIAEMLRGLP